MRIIVQPEQLRQNAQHLRMSSEFWHGQARQLRAALAGLDWETRRSAAVESQVQQAAALADRLVIQAEEKASFLEAAATRFEHADAVGAQGIAQASSQITIAPSTPRLLSGILFMLPRLSIGMVFARLLPLPGIVGVFGTLPSLAERIWDWLNGCPQRHAPVAKDSPSIPKGKLAQVILTGLERARREQPPGQVIQSIEVASPQRGGVRGPIQLVDVDPAEHRDSCALYAQARRPDLGPTDGQGGAADYIEKFRHKVFQLPRNASDLRQHLDVGYAVVWNRGHPTLSGTPGAQHGHVAVIEQVEPDAIVVSHTNWGDGFRMTINREQLVNWRLHFIP
jgi:hypothetical protein